MTAQIYTMPPMQRKCIPQKRDRTATIVRLY